jgi:serine/threonine protein kinase
VLLYDVVDDPKNDKLYLVLDYVEKGQVLKLDHDNLAVDPIPLEKAWSYFRDLIHGLNYRKFLVCQDILLS